MTITRVVPPDQLTGRVDRPAPCTAAQPLCRSPSSVVDARHLIGVKRAVSTCRRAEVADCAGLGVMVTDAARRGAPRCHGVSGWAVLGTRFTK